VGDSVGVGVAPSQSVDRPDVPPPRSQAAITASGLCRLKLYKNCGGFFRLARRKTAVILAVFQGLSTKSGGKKHLKNVKF